MIILLKNILKSPKKDNNSKSVALVVKSDSDYFISVNSFEQLQLDNLSMSGLTKLNTTDIEDPNMGLEVSDNSNIMDFIEKNESKKSPKIEDLMAGITATLRMLVSVQKDVKTTNSKIKLLDSKIELNSGNIQINHDNVQYNHELILKNIENVNFIKQQQIDRRNFEIIRSTTQRCSINKVN